MEKKSLLKSLLSSGTNELARSHRHIPVAIQMSFKRESNIAEKIAYYRLSVLFHYLGRCTTFRERKTMIEVHRKRAKRTSWSSSPELGSRYGTTSALPAFYWAVISCILSSSTTIACASASSCRASFLTGLSYLTLLRRGWWGTGWMIISIWLGAGQSGSLHTWLRVGGGGGESITFLNTTYVSLEKADFGLSSVLHLLTTMTLFIS